MQSIKHSLIKKNFLKSNFKNEKNSAHSVIEFLLDIEFIIDIFFSLINISLS